MTDSKRGYSDDVLVQGIHHDDKKQHTKPGRKPIDTEPKLKRTAQNRAAQRAYRERKEKKMKELEDRVADLEDDKIKAATELDLLRAQINLLKRELTRYRGHLDFSDFGIKAQVPVVKQEQLPETTPQDQKYAADFPWSKSNLLNLQVSSDASLTQLPDLVSGSSLSTSPLNDNIISPESNTSESSAGQLQLNLSPLNQFTMVNNFEEQLDPFCVNLNEACGTKEKPMPKVHRAANQVPPLNEKRDSVLSPQWNGVSPFQTLFTPNENLSDPFFADPNYSFVAPTDGFQNDPLSFLNDNNFDVSLAFGNATNDMVENPELMAQTDSLAGLTTEESAYDPLNSVNTDFNFNEFVKSSLPSDVSTRTNSVTENKSGSSVTSYHTSTPSILEEKEEVVPAPAESIRCSEIWDRITSHPRYTEIDIDGLCSELKSKAKCSERGVVVDAKDVNSLIERSAMRR